MSGRALPPIIFNGFLFVAILLTGKFSRWDFPGLLILSKGATSRLASRVFRPRILF